MRLEPPRVPAGHEMVKAIRTVVREARVPPDGAFAYGGRTPTPGDKHRQTPPTHSAASTARLTPWTPDSGDALARTTRREAPFIGSATHLTDGGPLRRQYAAPLPPSQQSRHWPSVSSSPSWLRHRPCPPRRTGPSTRSGSCPGRTSRPRRTSRSTSPSAPPAPPPRPCRSPPPAAPGRRPSRSARAPARPPPASRTRSSSSRAANRAPSP